MVIGKRNRIRTKLWPATLNFGLATALFLQKASYTRDLWRVCTLQSPYSPAFGPEFVAFDASNFGWPRIASVIGVPPSSSTVRTLEVSSLY